MKTKLFQNKLCVKKSKTHGYGVVAEKTIKKGALIEESYILVANGRDKKLENFYFEISRGRYAIFTGFGCIYNHSDEPNADYFINAKKRLVKFKALKTIRKGEEIFISYGGKWFSSRGLRAKV